ncbi:hypothetical protein QEZ54_16325 [Catellatospora sp. KI3]|uniref:hypothetical protein n=1 Tax=Catellatospora sp. KI3 TaxID=3041620 RepID=UPI002482F014|nr:hypothetical protein [Catellatospora sp. KI3]MDI1462539.1 hypothetical protein [Catellatospora sp. KI3]
MEFLEIRAVTPGPRAFLDGADPATGETVHTTVYSGYVVLGRSAGFRGAISLGQLQEISFFLPDSAPYPQPPTALWAELSVRRFRSTGNISAVHLGACDERVEVAPDPRGGEHRWLRLTFKAPNYSHDLVELNYRVTVQSR